MNELSNKAKVVYSAMKMLNANQDNKITSYTIMDFIEENEELQEYELLKDISEEDFVEIIMELNIKSVNTLIASMPFITPKKSKKGIFSYKRTINL